MAKKIRFYLDEHVPKAVARGLRRRGVDVLTVSEAAMLGASDEEHLDLAKGVGRTVFTQDDDFLRLHAAGIEHAGIVYAPQHTAVGRMVAGLMLIHQVLSAEDMANAVEFL